MIYRLTAQTRRTESRIYQGAHSRREPKAKHTQASRTARLPPGAAARGHNRRAHRRVSVDRAAMTTQSRGYPGIHVRGPTQTEALRQGPKWAWHCCHFRLALFRRRELMPRRRAPRAVTGSRSIMPPGAPERLRLPAAAPPPPRTAPPTRAWLLAHGGAFGRARAYPRCPHVAFGPPSSVLRLLSATTHPSHGHFPLSIATPRHGV